MAAVFRLIEDDERHGLAKGDLVLAVPYWLDPDKVTVICRVADGFDPECNQYRDDLRKVTDAELSEWAWERAKGATS